MKQYIENKYDQFINDFKTIINIDSSSDNKSGILEVAQFFEKRFQALGLETEIKILGEDQVPCLYAVNKINTPWDPPFDVMFLGHMDTVFPTGEVKKRPFSIQGNKAYGPGVSDMKGGLLIVLHALEALKHEGLFNSFSFCVAFNGDEETGSRASKEWIMQIAKKSQRTFVFEPCRPGYKFVLKRKGGGWFKVRVKGEEAHAGADPEKGVNAVVELAYQIGRINKLNDNDNETSAHVTMISGGNKANIIPNYAEACVDVRILKQMEKEPIETFFKTLNQHKLFKDSNISSDGYVERPTMEAGRKTMDLWELIQSTGKQMGLSLEAISTGGGSDGNFTSGAGTPTIDGMGIVGGNTHRADEYAELDSINNMIFLISSVCHKLVVSVTKTHRLKPL